jgi:hypothetical protein
MIKPPHEAGIYLAWNAGLYRPAPDRLTNKTASPGGTVFIVALKLIGDPLLSKSRLRLVYNDCYDRLFTLYIH